MTSRRRTTLRERWNLQRWTKIYNVEQRWINNVYFNIDLNNVRQCQSNIVIFNVDFYNVGQCRNNIVDMIIWKNKKQTIETKTRVKNKITFMRFKEHPGLRIFFILFPILRGICKRIFADLLKFLKQWTYRITKTIFKSFHFVKCQLFINFTTKKNCLVSSDTLWLSQL